MVSGGTVQGFIAAYFRLHDLLMSITTDETSEYAMALLVDGAPAAATSEWNLMHLRGHSIKREVALSDGTVWTLSVAPSKKLMAALDTALPGLALLTGLLLALMLSLLVRQAQAATLAARELRKANKLLNLEIGERRRAEGEVRALAQDLERRVAERTADLARANAALRTENRLRERAQVTLARANEDLRQFAAFVSHELRQPLASGQIWGELLESALGPDLDERSRKYLTQLRASITRMAAFLEGQLRLARAAYERREAAMEDVDMRDLVEQVVVSFKTELDEAGARIDVGDLPVLCADPTQMRQVFRNLIENALKYRREEVPLRIRIESARREEGGEPVCEISVRDNARGFSQHDAEEIFKIFRRLDDGTASGSGLGLALCRRIVEHHDGTISAVGHPGEGSTFVICLPGGLNDHAGSKAAS
jgi:signal transduction histidine kinase